MGLGGDFFYGGVLILFFGGLGVRCVYYVLHCLSIGMASCLGANDSREAIHTKNRLNA